MPIKISQLVKDGKDTKKTVQIKSMGDSIELGPLSRKEWGEVEELESEAMGDIENTQKEIEDKKGFRQTSKREKARMRSELKMTMNVKTQIVQSRTARTRAIYLSARKFDDKLEEADVEEMTTNVFDEIYDKVLEISGIPRDEEERREIEKKTKNFPNDK